MYQLNSYQYLTDALPVTDDHTVGGAGENLMLGGYKHRNRSLALDMLRGIAILLVLGFHYVVAPAESGWLRSLASAWTRIGWSGVDLFFVLSGFLVSGLLFSEFQQRKS